MADEEFLPSAPEPDEPEPAERFTSEIDELIAERQALQTVDANALPARYRVWDDVMVPLAQTGRDAWAQRLDLTVAGLAVVSLIGCAMLLFALMSGEQTPVPSRLLSLTTPTSASSAVAQVSSTPTAKVSVSATPSHVPQPTPALL